MANFHEVMDMNQRSMPKKGNEKAPELKRMEYERSANGGHMFTHRMEQGERYVEPKTHTFGKEEGAKALSHFAEHAGLSEHMGEVKEEAGDGEAVAEE